MEIPSSSYIFQESDFEDDPNNPASVFHPSAFVGKYRKGGFSLETLREQLQSYSSSIKQNLFVIINRDYKDFITIATSLDGVDARIEYIRKPLLDLRADLSTLHDGLVSSLRSIQDRLATHNEVAFRKKLVETFLDTAHKIQSAQSILSADYDTLATSTSEVKSQTKRELLVRMIDKKYRENRDQLSAFKKSFVCSEIERAAYELSEVTNNLAIILSLLNQQREHHGSSGSREAILRGSTKRSEKQLHHTLETQVASLTKLLMQKLTSNLASILAAEDLNAQRNRDTVENHCPTEVTQEKALIWKAFGHCLRACNVVKRGDIAEKIVAEAVVEPSIRTHMTSAKVDGKNGRGSFSGLDNVLQAILTSIRAFIVPYLNECEAVLSLSSADGGVSADLIVRSIWVPITTAILDKYSGMFSIGIPSVLSSCYRTIDRFLDSLQKLVSPIWRPALARRLLAHPTVKVFQAKWKLDVYYQLRCNEVLSRIEKACYVSAKHGLSSSIARNLITIMCKGSEDEKDTKKASSGEMATISHINSHISHAVTLSPEDYQQLHSEILGYFNNVEFQCSIFNLFAVELTACLQKTVLLPPLSSKFFTFILRILQRLEAQVAAVSNILTPSFSKLTVDQIKQSVLQTMNKTASSSAKVSADAATEKESGSSTTSAAAVSTLTSVPVIQSADELMLLVQDLLAFKTWVSEDLQARVKAAMLEIIRHNIKTSDTVEPEAESKQAAIETSISSCFQVTQSNLRSTAGAVWLKMSQLVAAECKKGLVSSVKGIAGKFRMTNKPPPDSASAFIEPIFNPLRKLHSSHGSVIAVFQSTFADAEDKNLASVAATWQADLINDVSSNYYEQLKALMETVKQMDSALMRRSKMRAGTATNASGAGGNMSDSEKIYLQITLDIDAFGLEVEQLGLDPTSLRSFRELKDLKADIATQIAAIHQS